MSRRYVVTPAPRLGAGVGLLGFVIWVTMALFWAVWQIGLLIVFAVVALVSLIVGLIGEHRAKAP